MRKQPDAPTAKRCRRRRQRPSMCPNFEVSPAVPLTPCPARRLLKCNARTTSCARCPPPARLEKWTAPPSRASCLFLPLSPCSTLSPSASIRGVGCFEHLPAVQGRRLRESTRLLSGTLEVLHPRIPLCHQRSPPFCWVALIRTTSPLAHFAFPSAPPCRELFSIVAVCKRRDPPLRRAHTALPH